jgi:hypothetical protein
MMRVPAREETIDDGRSLKLQTDGKEEERLS